ncbi:class II glutamine amidotransferase [Streptomyces sp. NPDC006923]|uniref:class II glutamine amidotransferase n=1 Tax=Streptomyces sp. NPDC006923 TaxID=3155355 RepID=UPI0033C12E8B
MCRLLGVVAGEPAPVSDLLSDDLDPFLALACEHSHGWGFAFRSRGGAVESVKEPASAERSTRLRPLLTSCTTDAALLHLRMASEGFPVTMANTHPFGDAETAFAHNGDFTPYTSLDGVIGPELLTLAEGDTDSERFSLAVRRRMNDGLSPAKALIQTADDLRSLTTGFASLNCLLLTPTALLAYTEHDAGSEVIQRRGAGYFGLHYRQHGNRTVVASTGWPHPEPEWTTLPERHVLEIARGGAPRVTVYGA